MELQAEIIQFIQSFSNPFLDIFFIIITNFGSAIFYLIMIPIFYWSIDKKIGITLVISLMFSMYLNVTLKNITAIPRPIGSPGIRSLFVSSAGGFSFPSGHAQGTATFWGVVMQHYKSRQIYFIGIIMIFLVSLSRLYLGLHWPSDVAAGIILGLLMSWIFTVVPKKLKPLPMLYSIILMIAIAFGLAFLFPYKDNFIYMGLSAGSFVGYKFEDYLIGFKPQSKNKLKTLEKYVIGLGGFLLIYTVLKLIMPQHGFFSLLKYFVVGIWLTFGAPAIFCRLSL